MESPTFLNPHPLIWENFVMQMCCHLKKYVSKSQNVNESCFQLKSTFFFFNLQNTGNHYRGHWDNHMNIAAPQYEILLLEEKKEKKRKKEQGN